MFKILVKNGNKNYIKFANYNLLIFKTISALTEMSETRLFSLGKVMVDLDGA